MGLRRRSRELTLQFLFQNEFGLKAADGNLFARFAEHFSVEPEVLEYASQLAAGMTAYAAEVDALIQSNSAHWKISRMSLVDLNVMRIAVFEMKFMNPQVPPSVAINEAVEVAKKYGSTDSGGFVNGILDNVAKGI
jgi:transcription antitermination protein NusB